MSTVRSVCGLAVNDTRDTGSGAATLVITLLSNVTAPVIERSLPVTDAWAPSTMAPEETIVPRKPDAAPKVAAPVIRKNTLLAIAPLVNTICEVAPVVNALLNLIRTYATGENG